MHRIFASVLIRPYTCIQQDSGLPIDLFFKTPNKYKLEYIWNEIKVPGNIGPLIASIFEGLVNRDPDIRDGEVIFPVTRFWSIQ